MKRNNSFSFRNVPIVRHKRSRFDLSHRVLTSGNVGTLYPFEVREVYPGDSFKCETTVVTRLSSSFFKPLMDNIFLDVYYFYVPSRLLYDKFPNVFGENTQSAWANSQEYFVPSLYKANVNVPAGGVADHLGLPVGVSLTNNDDLRPSVLPFRGFAKIYDEWFRDENNVAPMHIQQGDAHSSEVINNNDWAANNYTGKLPKVAKMHDYFTSCLPAPQKGAAVDLPLSLTGSIPVLAGDDHSLNGKSVHVTGSDGTDVSYTGNFVPLSMYGNGTTGVLRDMTDDVSGNTGDTHALMFSNLWAVGNKTGMLSGMSVNELRFAFQFQKMLERDARGGTRYIEYLMNAYGVSPGDTRLQRSEFLGGKRMPISITQVTQTTGYSDDAQTPQTLAEVGAYSLSGGKSRFTKSFVEHGYIIGVFCLRQFHSYKQGLQKFWTRSKRTDFYDPVFANIGEQPVYKYELYANDTTLSDGSIFGYQEAFADLRQAPNQITGAMRSDLDIWHLGDSYANAPTLNAGFIEETPGNVDRVITVPSSSQDQFILDFYLKMPAIRVMPTYSVPSLIDHN